MRRLTSLDAQFLAGEGGASASHYAGLAIYDQSPGTPRVDASIVRQIVAERLEHLEPFRWKLVEVPLGLDHPVFVEADVDLDAHIVDIDLPPGADERALASAVGEVLAKPLARDRPLWRIVVFHGLTEKVAVATVLHHATADGLAARDLFLTMLEPEDPSLIELESAGAPVPGVASGGAVRPADLLLRGLMSAATQPVRALRVAQRTLPHLDQSPVLRSLPGVDAISRAARATAEALFDGAPSLVQLPPRGARAPRTRFNGRLEGGRAVAFASISFTDVKAVKRACGVTVNDVVLALCAGALRRRMTAQDELLDEPLLAYVPINVRLPDSATSGNAISSVIAPIPIHLGDPLERIAYVHEVMSAAKDRQRQVPLTFLTDSNSLIPTPLFPYAARAVMDLLGSGFVDPTVNLLVSNVPGPPVLLTLGGAKLEAHYPLSLVFHGLALNITVVSYVDQLDVGIVGDPRAVPDGWEMLDDLKLELAHTVEAIGGSPPHVAPTTAT